jgi:hypothetical protein
MGKQGWKAFEISSLKKFKVRLEKSFSNVFKKARSQTF